MHSSRQTPTPTQIKLYVMVEVNKMDAFWLQLLHWMDDPGVFHPLLKGNRGGPGLEGQCTLSPSNTEIIVHEEEASAHIMAHRLPLMRTLIIYKLTRLLKFVGEPILTSPIGISFSTSPSKRQLNNLNESWTWQKLMSGGDLHERRMILDIPKND